MVLVLGDLLADYSLRVPNIFIQPKDLQLVSYLEIGPGGAANIAITTARFGLATGCMGEVGDDMFGRTVIDGLNRENIDTSNILVTPGARTPVANVLVDDRGEPAYLGFPGDLQLAQLPEAWREPIQQSEALFSDGWVEYPGATAVILEAFHLARAAGVPVFFDPGPGNPDINNAWHLEAAALSTVLLATDEEAAGLTAQEDPLSVARALLEIGPELVILKRGIAGCLLVNQSDLTVAPGYPVKALDATGAGDSLAGAVIYGYLRGLDLLALGTLANATGAAKVKKLGTGLNMPWPAEVQLVLDRFGKGEYDFGLLD